jgi:hypothetical protein
MLWRMKRERGQLGCSLWTRPTYRFDFEWIHCSVVILFLILGLSQLISIYLVPVAIAALAITFDLLAQPCLSAYLQAHPGTRGPPLPAFLPLHRSLRWLWQTFLA